MRSFVLLLAVFLVLLVVNVYESATSKAVNDADVTGEFGEPIPGLNAFELLNFDRGRDIFTKRFRRERGLGPHFNATSCASCHEDPAPGGSSQRYRDFFLAGNRREDGSIAKLYPDCTSENRDTHRTEPCLSSLVMPHYGPKGTSADPVSTSVEHPQITPDADVVARRNAPPIFGVGLFRLVPDEEILSRADPDDADGDGISGRVNIISSEEDAVGRFGYKCQTASIEAFNRGALHNQMGITSNATRLVAMQTPAPGFLDTLLEAKTAHAQVAQPVDPIVDYDGAPDPEISRSGLLALIFFQENLAAPPRGARTAAVRRGEALFRQIGCASCHVPTLSTPLGDIHPFSDLLIHDMGPDLADGIVMERASGSEFRTQPLWGLCEHPPFLHGGQADIVEEAILLHGGEAERARDNYAELDTSLKQDLHRFLESL